jgi:hypothetical protein
LIWFVALAKEQLTLVTHDWFHGRSFLFVLRVVVCGWLNAATEFGNQPGCRLENAHRPDLASAALVKLAAASGWAGLWEAVLAGLIVAPAISLVIG